MSTHGGLLGKCEGELPIKSFYLYIYLISYFDDQSAVSEMKKIVIVKEFYEISDTISLTASENKIVQHAELPTVKNELSVTLYLKLKSISSDWPCIFRKGIYGSTRTPGLWLTSNNKLHPRFTGNWNWNAGIDELATELSLNKWYHISYTLSDSEKRLDIYIDGLWVGFYGIQEVQTQKVLFNTEELVIGSNLTAEIRNFRYFNWRLTPEEVGENILKMKKVVKEFYEISDTISITVPENKIVQHAELPTVKDELSVTLHLKLKSVNSDWAKIFHKGTDHSTCTPGLWLTPNNKLHPRFTSNWGWTIGIDEIAATELSLNKWYHISYTLSDSEKRLDFYIDGLWVGFYGIQEVQIQKVLFNTEPLLIGSNLTAEIRNFRYFNWRLTAEEVWENIL
ncbi:12947_t:CDS:2, partial [Entrophospora sp. SA101]